MSAINLQKDLEALYYFDEQNFDSQRNLLRDHSGYGRHAEASGGPTVGVEGPDDFGATSFDGSDDTFVGENMGLGSDTWTIFTLLNTNDVSLLQTPFGTAKKKEKGYGMTFNGSFEAHLNPDGGGGGTGVQVSVPSNTWLMGVAEFDVSGDMKIAASWGGNNHRIASVDISSYADTVETTKPLTIGEVDNNPFAGEMAFAGAVSRKLSDAEIAQLNRLTAPRRAQL